jgi:hypothetical protein
MYVFEFMYLACDISWDEAMFVNQFQFKLRGDVKDFMLTMHDPTTLSQVIMQIVCYDNQFFERR